jgi:transposase
LAARKDIKVTREQLTSWYYDEGKSTREIAELLGIGQANVVYWMNKLEISRRSKSEALTKTLRRDFSGDLAEKAYLIGF